MLKHSLYPLLILVMCGCVSNPMIKEQKRLNDKIDAIAAQMMQNDLVFDAQHQALADHTAAVCKPRAF